MEKKLVPYSVYLPKEYYDKIREHAKARKASSLVRDAICMILDGDDNHKAGYNKALRDAIKIIEQCKAIQPFAFNGRYVSETLIDKIAELKQ
jgi:Arc/MetJ-type ribon-helix-helix transcriptional regulator